MGDLEMSALSLWGVGKRGILGCERESDDGEDTHDPLQSEDCSEGRWSGVWDESSNYSQAGGLHGYDEECEAA